MLINLNSILPQARKQGIAIGAFNFNDLEFLQGILTAAEEIKSPVILQTSESALDYMGLDYVGAMTEPIRKRMKMPVVLHLDHGRNLKLIKKVINSGFYSSVMFDGSSLPYAENIKKTREIVKLAHQKNISVEAELGILKGAGDKTASAKSFFTNPQQAADFVKKTNCDALAVAIGTSHGAYKFKGRPKLDLKRLKQIAELVKIPLVLHGASGISPRLLKIMKKKCEKIGDCGRLAGAKGVPDSEIKKAIKLGIAKINIDTDLRLAFTAADREILLLDKKVTDPRKYLGAGREAVKEVVKEKIKLFSK